MKNSTEQKKRILVASAKLFREKSFANTSVDKIASRLGINKAMIYYYFKSKGFLLYTVMVSSIDERIKEAELVTSAGTPPEKMRKLIKQIIKAHAKPISFAGVAQFELKNLPRLLIKPYIAKRDKFEQIIRNILQEGIKTGYFRKEIDLPMAGRLILGVLNSITTWYKKDGPLSPEEIGEQVWEFIAHSIQNNYTREPAV